MKPTAIRALVLGALALILCSAACAPLAFAQAQPQAPAPAEPPSGGFAMPSPFRW